MNKILGMLIFLFSIVIIGCGFDQDDTISPQEILFFHNKERTIRKIHNLEFDEGLSRTAQKHAEWMALNSNLQHSRLKLDGTGFFIMGENIAMGYRSIDTVIDGWMNSPGHRKNILNVHYTHAGIGYSKMSGGVPYWCVVFGGK